MRPPWATLVITAAILVATLTPAAAVPRVGISGADLVVHVVMFALWAGIATWQWPGTSRQVVVFGFGFALVTELLQLLIPGRAFAWTDLLADAVGVALGAAIGSRLVARRQDKSAKSA